MPLYGGIDLHSTNSVIVVISEQDEVIYQKRLPNDLPTILEQLAPYQTALQGVVVESTYNWYWLVDGLRAAAYRVHLANPAAIQQYNGLKYSDDHSDARWLAHLLRLGVLPEGYIYPKAERAVRDLLRKRAHWVRQHTANVLSVQNIIVRNTGARLSIKRIRALPQHELAALLPEADQVLAITSSLAVLDCLSQQIKALETVVHQRLQHTPAYEQLLTHSTELCGRACHRYSKASGGEDLQIEEPVCGGYSAAFHFHATLAGMLGPTLIRDEIVQVGEPREKRLLAAPGMMESLHHEQFPADGVMGLI
jgi:transposase